MSTTATLAVLLMGSALTAASPSPPPPSLAELRAEAERILRDYGAGRLAAVEARFKDEVRPKAAAALAASERMGELVRIDSARLLTHVRSGGQSLIVLDADVTFRNGASFAELGFVRVGDQWRLHALVVGSADRPPLSDDGVPAAARALLQVAQLGGLTTLADVGPAVARDKPVEEMRADAERPQALLGRLRRFQPQDVEFVWYRCRKVSAPSQFEHGQATVHLTLCPNDGAWRLFQYEVQPTMTAALFERTVSLAVSRELKRSDAAVRCPATLVPVGGTVTCRLTTGGRTRELQVRRVTEAGVEISGLE